MYAVIAGHKSVIGWNGRTGRTVRLAKVNRPGIPGRSIIVPIKRGDRKAERSSRRCAALGANRKMRCLAARRIDTDGGVSSDAAGAGVGGRQCLIAKRVQRNSEDAAAAGEGGVIG